MLTESALHQTLLVVYSVLWAAATPTFGRLRLFAINNLTPKAWARLAWGLAFGNAVPVAGLAALMLLPEVNGFRGFAAGAAIGLWPAVLPRLLHAFTASNECLRWYHTKSEATQVLQAWDKQWFEGLPAGWRDANWDRLGSVREARDNGLWRHLAAAGLVALLPLTATLVVAALAC